jgi:hypothetical protein
MTQGFKPNPGLEFANAFSVMSLKFANAFSVPTFRSFKAAPQAQTTLSALLPGLNQRRILTHHTEVPRDEQYYATLELKRMKYRHTKINTFDS